MKGILSRTWINQTLSILLCIAMALVLLPATTPDAVASGTPGESLQLPATTATDLHAAISAAPADGTVYVAGAITLDATISIDKNITIIGVPIAFLDISVSNRHINSSAGSLTLESIVFAGRNAGKNDTPGGGIYMSGAGSQLTLENCTLRDCYTPYLNQTSGDRGSGGAVCSMGSVDMTDCTFADNTAGRNGGAVFASDGVVVNGGTFSTNTALRTTAQSVTAGGGAIFSAEGIIINAVFTGNTSSGSGGAVRITDLVAANTLFTGNHAMNDGGATFGHTVSLYQCTVTGNAATGGSATAGGIYIGTGAIYGSLITENFPADSNNTGAYATTAGQVSDNTYDGVARYNIIGSPSEGLSALISAATTSVGGQSLAVAARNGDGSLSAPDSSLLRGAIPLAVMQGWASADAHLTNTALNNDINGYARTDSATVDIGAFRFEKPTPPPSSSAPSKTIKVSEVDVGIFGGHEDLVKAKANMTNAFSRSVEVRLNDDTEAQAAFSLLLGDDTEVYPFDLSVYIKGTDTKTQPKDGYAVTMTLPLPEELWDSREQVRVVRVMDDELEVLASELKQVDGVWCIIFDADHFSPYALVAGEITAPEPPFTDIDGHWAQADILYMWRKGLMQGTSATRFRPDASMTRAMVVTTLWCMEGQPEADGDRPFPDLTDEAYMVAVMWAAENDIVKGYDNGLFAPDDHITREQFAAILWRYATWKGTDVSVGEDTNILSYNDAFDISEYAIAAMQWACGEGVISGKPGGMLDPQGDTTRAEAAALLHRFLED